MQSPEKDVDITQASRTQAQRIGGLGRQKAYEQVDRRKQDLVHALKGFRSRSSPDSRAISAGPRTRSSTARPKSSLGRPSTRSGSDPG